MPTLRIANIKAAGRDVSFVAGQPPKGALSAARLSAKAATKNIWRSSAVCQIFGFALSAELHDAQALAIDAGRRSVSATLNTTAQPRDQVSEVLAARRAWALFAVNWSEDLLSLNRWGSQGRK